MSNSEKSRGTLVSPSFSGKQWKCMRFWFRIGIGHKAQIGVSINSSNTTEQLWKSAHRTSKWSFVQLSINTSGIAKVILPQPLIDAAQVRRARVKNGYPLDCWLHKRFTIDPMQKWLPLNYSFVHIQNSLINLARDNKFFRIFVSKTRLVRLF